MTNTAGVASLTPCAERLARATAQGRECISEASCPLEGNLTNACGS